MSKRTEDDNTKDSLPQTKTLDKLYRLQRILGTIGYAGTAFIGRLENSESIPNKQSESDKEILRYVDQLAISVPSEPYSALVLQGNTLYIAQNQATAGEDETLKALKASPAFNQLKAALKAEEIKVELHRYTPNGDHPDTVAIAQAINKGNSNKNDPVYLGLAAFEGAKVKEQKPASCAGCASVIKALNDNGYHVKVNLSTPTNFPSNINYKIPSIISNDPQLMDSYLLHVENSILKLQQQLSTVNESDLYIQYATRDGVKTIMITANPDKNKAIKELKENAKSEYNIGQAEDVQEFKKRLPEFRENISNARSQIPGLRSEKAIRKFLAEQTKLLEQQNTTLEDNGIFREKAAKTLDAIKGQKEQLKGYEQTKKTIQGKEVHINNYLKNLQKFTDTLELKQKLFKEAQSKLQNFESQLKFKNDGKTKPKSKGTSGKEADTKKKYEYQGTEVRDHQGYKNTVIKAKQDFEDAETVFNNKAPKYSNLNSTLNSTPGEDLAQLKEEMQNIEKRIAKTNRGLKVLNKIVELESDMASIDNRLPQERRRKEGDKLFDKDKGASTIINKIIEANEKPNNLKDLSKSEISSSKEKEENKFLDVLDIIVNDEENAFNQRENVNYLYQDRDLELLAPKLIDSSKVNLGIYSDDQMFSKIESIKQNFANLNKPIIGLYNKGGGHWTTFSILKDEKSDVQLLYKDSQGQECPNKIKDVAKSYNGNTEVVLIENIQQEQGVKKDAVDFNCGIYALKNAQTIYNNITNQDSKQQFINNFKTQKFCDQSSAEAARKDEFSELYVQAVYDETKNTYIESKLKNAILEHHKSELEEFGKKEHSGNYEVVDTFEKSEHTENKMYLEIADIKITSDGNYTYEYKTSNPNIDPIMDGPTTKTDFDRKNKIGLNEEKAKISDSFEYVNTVPKNNTDTLPKNSVEALLKDLKLSDKDKGASTIINKIIEANEKPNNLKDLSKSEISSSKEKEENKDIPEFVKNFSKNDIAMLQKIKAKTIDNKNLPSITEKNQERQRSNSQPSKSNTMSI